MAIEHAADEDLLDDAQTRIEALLRRDGYRDAKASYTRTVTDQGLVVTFDIARGPEYRVGAVAITGGDGVPRELVNRLLAVSTGQPYSLAKVNAGVTALRQEYYKRGYFKAQVTPVPTEAGPPAGNIATMDVSIAVNQGPKALVTDVVFEPASPHVPLADLRGVIRTKAGDPFVAAATLVDLASIETLYHNRGFPTAEIKADRQASDDDRAITITFTIDEGPQIFVQDIRVIGNHRVDTPAILDTMAIHAGGPLGAAAVQKSRQDVQAAFGFRSVSIADEPVLTNDSRRHVIVTVEEAPATTIAWGGGILVDRRPVADVPGGPASQHLDVGPRGSFEISRQNLGGRNRALDFFTRLGVRSNPNLDGNPFGFVDYLVQTQYNEHRAFQTPLDITFGASSERDVQTDFNYVKQVLKAEAQYRASRHVTLTEQYALQFTNLFDQSIPAEQRLLIDRVFPQKRLSIVSSGVLWDRRNDPIAPSNGTLTSADFEVAPKALGSEFGFVKTLFQTSGYRAIDNGGRFVGAARAEVGLAHGFSRDTLKDINGNDILDPTTGLPIVVAPLPASERFYAGGGTTVRGFNEDVLGVPALITDQGLSLGGNGLVVLNLELRTRVLRLAGKDISVVTFIDGGNVFPNASDISLKQLRGTVGFGVRYNSPLGPIRLDYGFKLTRLPLGNGSLEPGWTWHLSVGQAF
jgi:outer membrane protein assembly complex protein YaeT